MTNTDGKDLVLNRDGEGKVESITVSFTEDLKPGTVSVEDFEVDGYTVGNIALDEDASKVVITLEDAGNAGDSYTVRFVGSVSDKDGNAYEGKGIELAGAKDTAAPTVNLTTFEQVNNGKEIILTFSTNEVIDFATDADVKISYFTKNAEGKLVAVSNKQEGGDFVKDKTWSGYLWTPSGSYSQGEEQDKNYKNVIPANTVLSTLVKDSQSYVGIDWTKDQTIVVKVEVTDNSGNVSDVATDEVDYKAPVAPLAGE
ncbi:Ig-like domain-containing protein [Brevibacillus sp. AY1]|uniref:Ig-like domain-containing protein n=1 Tax=Brevibacillus sp. AY1 TaxID=2807621 RepID=UPI00245638D6|nr:Ig-like domain-containing protein [Brevibacillus sp. AY1]MDH4620001.1 Ig-like domain-containing protein [Brevibacillus sp. AY1]